MYVPWIHLRILFLWTPGKKGLIEKDWIRSVKQKLNAYERKTSGERLYNYYIMSYYYHFNLVHYHSRVVWRILSVCKMGSTRSFSLLAAEKFQDKSISYKCKIST